MQASIWESYGQLNESSWSSRLPIVTYGLKIQICTGAIFPPFIDPPKFSEPFDQNTSASSSIPSMMGAGGRRGAEGEGAQISPDEAPKAGPLMCPRILRGGAAAVGAGGPFRQPAPQLGGRGGRRARRALWAKDVMCFRGSAPFWDPILGFRAPPNFFGTYLSCSLGGRSFDLMPCGRHESSMGLCKNREAAKSCKT